MPIVLRWRALLCLPVLLTLLAGCGGGGQAAAIAPTSPPTYYTELTGIHPTSWQAGGKPFTLSVFSKRAFTKSSQVIWNGAPLPTTFINVSELQASVTTADLAASSGFITVSTPGWECDDCGIDLELETPGDPTISSLSPAGVEDGSAGFTLQVLGQNFIPASYVQWNGTTLPTTYVSSSELDVQVPATDVAAVGTAAVSVEDAIQDYYNPVTSYFMIGYNVTVLDVAANDLAWDPSRQLLYISVKDDGTIAHHTSIATYDPATGTLGTLADTTPLDVDRLKITDDSAWLYVGLGTYNQVERLALPGGTVDETINLPPTSVGAPYPMDIEVQPGSPHTIAVLQGEGGLSVIYPAGINIYDDTTPRANPLPAYYNGHEYDSTSIQWSADGTKLYGADGLDTDFSFFIMDVDSTGITTVSQYDNVFPDFATNITLDPVTGYLFDSDYEVIDPSVPDLVYNSACIGYYAIPDDTTGRAYYLDSSQIALGSTGYSILTCDKATGNLLSTVNLPMGQLYPTSFIRFGTDGLAFVTADGKIVLVQGHVVAP